MVDIYLCRHGQSAANAAGIIAGHINSPLTDIGKSQAKELAELAKNAGLSFDCVYTSPLIRAKDTAKIIAKDTGSPKPVIMEGLIERGFGVLTGRHFSEIEKFSKKILRTDRILYFLDAEGAETFPQALVRAKKILNTLRLKHKTGKVLLVTHGDIGMMLFAAFHKTSWKDVLQHFYFGNSELLLLKEDLHHKPHVFEIDQRGVSGVAESL